MNNVHIHIEGSSVSDLLEELRALLGASTSAQHDKVMAAVAEVKEEPIIEHENQTTLNAAPAAEPKKRGRPKKSDASPASDTAAPVPPTVEPASTVAQESVTPEVPAGSPAPLLSFGEFKAALNELAVGNGGKNLTLCTKALNEYGYGRVKDVKPEHFTSVVEKAKELVAA